MRRIPSSAPTVGTSSRTRSSSRGARSTIASANATDMRSSCTDPRAGAPEDLRVCGGDAHPRVRAATRSRTRPDRTRDARRRRVAGDRRRPGPDERRRGAVAPPLLGPARRDRACGRPDPLGTATPTAAGAPRGPAPAGRCGWTTPDSISPSTSTWPAGWHRAPRKTCWNSRRRRSPRRSIRNGHCGGCATSRDSSAVARRSSWRSTTCSPTASADSRCSRTSSTVTRSCSQHRASPIRVPTTLGSAPMRSGTDGTRCGIPRPRCAVCAPQRPRCVRTGPDGARLDARSTVRPDRDGCSPSSRRTSTPCTASLVLTARPSTTSS